MFKVIINNMKLSLFIIAVVVVALAIAFYFFVPPLVSKNAIRFDFPDFFPKEMISDPYIISLEVTPDSPSENEKHRFIVSYGSHKSGEENKQSFKKYFKENGFNVEEAKGGEIEFIYASKEKTSINISLFKENPLKVSILYIVSK